MNTDTKIKNNSFSNVIKGISRADSIKDVGSSILSIILALIIGGLIVLLIGESPLTAYKSLFFGAFGSVKGIANTFTKSIPLLFTGLAVGVAFRCGLLNIGGEGQLYIGAFTSVIAAIFFPPIPRIILLPVIILLGMLAGALWGSFAGVLKAKYGIHEVIVTVMTNYIAIQLTSYFVNYPFKAEGWIAQTEMVPAAAALNRLIPKTQLTSALFIALAAVVIVYILLWKTSLGFEIRSTGENPTAAESGGISIARNTILAMAVSGGIAALAGITQTLGLYGRFIDKFSPGFGFTGIAVAVLGRNHPFGIALTALLFGALDAGALQMNRETSISSNLVVIIQGLVILFVAAPEIVRAMKLRRGEN
ncbi:MAG: ABC transporter permease [Clostridia bacterium]